MSRRVEMRRIASHRIAPRRVARYTFEKLQYARVASIVLYRLLSRSFPEKLADIRPRHVLGARSDRPGVGDAKAAVDLSFIPDPPARYSG